MYWLHGDERLLEELLPPELGLYSLSPDWRKSMRFALLAFYLDALTPALRAAVESNDFPLWAEHASAFADALFDFVKSALTRFVIRFPRSHTTTSTILSTYATHLLLTVSRLTFECART